MVGLAIKRLEGETWRDCAARIARKNGLELEVMVAFDEAIKRGVPDDEAAWEACYEWDVCDLAP